ncbi:MAG: 1,3-beta-galactosyl-N-acetylhexosamine phosphorylase [Opitutales bacterium]|nr:1,3-beta-galactosyl-N-acetylhexosamine phosphorylase [Opitutales bacterium]
MSNPTEKGHFTLPGEAGYEDLTLELAEKWGADCIRDSDGTTLSDKILDSGYDIYSTLCLVRADNSWAKANRDKLQQNFLMSDPVIAEGDTVTVDLMKGYFREQFQVNANDDAKEWWQVFDRTTGEEVSSDQWDFDKANGKVTICNTQPWHKYTVNFLAYRIWEAISMYNHITNNWGDREHLMPVDPVYPETQEFMLKFLRQWLEEHPATNVVRFTSMFYNFCWFWGEDAKNHRFRYSDWGSYDFTVSPLQLKNFEKARGYRLTSEDFVNKGYFRSTHNVPSERYRDWMDFVNEFVTTFGRQCVDLVHEYGKKAYVFYDDHWVGVEPYSKRFKDFNFDGLIKCVFNGFEARKNAAVEGAKTHELRLHPYLFPTGLTGEPTFKEGGDPTLDAKNFWVQIRRALLRAPVQRIGLGGYLSLVKPFPDFIDYIAKVADEFRLLRSFHQDDAPYVAPAKVGVLTSWGKLRSWICSGHMHEQPELDLNHVNEALAGLPVDVEFLSFDDIRKNGVPSDIKVLINCGRVNSAWSGGQHWQDPKVVTAITEWVAQGGGLVGIAEPSATEFSSQYFQLSHVLGVEREIGRTLSKVKYSYAPPKEKHFILKDSAKSPEFGREVDKVFAVDGATKVLDDAKGSIRIAARSFGKGKSVYFSGFRCNAENTRLLFRALLWASNTEEAAETWMTSNVNTESAYYPKRGKLVVINNNTEPEKTTVTTADGKKLELSLNAHDIQIVDV